MNYLTYERPFILNYSLFVLFSVVDFQFRTCGAMGSKGPTQNQCNRAYESKDYSVKVTTGNGKITAGVQLWTVNKTDTYTINAVGAFGGRSIRIQAQWKPKFVSVNCNLTENDQLYILVGQRGDAAYCREHDLKGKAKITCELNESGNKSALKEAAGGGGGGGGASFVFKKSKGVLIPLVISGGADGRGIFRSEEYMQHKTYNIKKNLINKIGQPPCPEALKAGWNTYGGFGGGEGGCKNGGKGGFNGLSYINTDFCANDTLSIFVDPSHTEEDGMVEVVEYLQCPEECETCMLVFRQNGSTCLDCFKAGERMADKYPCNGSKNPKQLKETENQLSRVLKIAVAPFCTLLIAAISICLLYSEF